MLRMFANMETANVLSTSSPVGWPKASLMRLNQSRSINAIEQGAWMRWARAISSSSIRMMQRRLNEPVSSSSSASSSIIGSLEFGAAIIEHLSASNCRGVPRMHIVRSL
jgi:hypothetical protein